jgi:hypothetical protein
MRSLILTALAIFFIGYAVSLMNKGSNAQRYERKAMNQWNSLTKGEDPTDE